MKRALFPLVTATFLAACQMGDAGPGVPLPAEDIADSEGSSSGPPSEAAAPVIDLSERDAEAVRLSAADYVREESAIADVRVDIEAAADGWVRVRVVPAGAVTDPATLYMKKDGGRWTGVVIGTAFAAEDLDQLGVPAAIRY